MALLIPDESSLVMLSDKKLRKIKNAAGYHPGPVPPSTADPAILMGISSTQSERCPNE